MKNSSILFKNVKYHSISVCFRTMLILLIFIAFKSTDAFAQQQTEQIQTDKHHKITATQDTVTSKSKTNDAILNKEAIQFYITPVSVIKEQQRKSTQPESTAKKEE